MLSVLLLSPHIDAEQLKARIIGTFSKRHILNTKATPLSNFKFLLQSMGALRDVQRNGQKLNLFLRIMLTVLVDI